MAAAAPAAGAATGVVPTLATKALAAIQGQSQEVGRQIFVYNHIRTNQVVYSLSRSMKNGEALKQISFVGKNSVPRALRKDHWTALCVLSFPNQLQGLNAYQKLREYKHLHEVAYPLEAVTQKEGKHAGLQLVPKKEKTRILMNQKANSIADIAAVLLQQAQPPTEKEIKRATLLVNGPNNMNTVQKRRKGPGSRETSATLEYRGKMAGVGVWWADTYDAEYAETWPTQVIHGPLVVNRGTAVWPPPGGLLKQVKKQYMWKEVEKELEKEPEKTTA